MRADGRSGWAATDFEFRFRPWIFAAIFFGAFQLYSVDRLPAFVALARLLPGGDGWARRAVWGVGVAAAFAAAALRTWAAAYLRSRVIHDRQLHDTRLVADGPYRFVRNPLYLGTVLLAFAIGLAASRSGLVLLVAGVTLFVYRLILREEQGLLRAQGESYQRYVAAVPRFVPSVLPRLPASGARPEWLQALGGELFMWCFALAVTLYAATGSARMLTWGCVAATVLVLAMGRWGARRQESAAQ